MKAIRVTAIGGPEVLRIEETPIPEPKAGEVLIKIKAVGVNYIDVYHRKGQYKLPTPFTPGLEAMGVVEKVGANVSDFKIGDRVAYTGVAGSYAEYNVAPAERLVAVPAGIDDHTAAAAMLQGLTAHYLAHSTYAIQQNDFVLIHAAAGGVGQLLTQMAHLRGAQIIAIVSTKEKAELVRKLGAQQVILTETTDFPAEIKKLTNGAGVHVVYDGVGKDTFERSLHSLRRRGIMVSFGGASGPVPATDLSILADRGSLYLTRPRLNDYIADRKELVQRSSEVFEMIKSGKLKLQMNKPYPLAEAKQAHQDLESRRTAGKLLLIP